MSSDLGQTLSELHRQGRFDSEGRFTVDSQKARQKLAAFRLADPRSFPLHLLAAAVSSQATEIRVESRPGRFEIEFDGKPFSELELRSLAPSLLGDSRELSRLQDLAIAITAASRLNGEVTVRSGESVLTVSRKGSHHLETGPEREGTHLVIREKTRWVDRWRSSSAPPEADLLQRRGRYCPLPLYLNGRRIDNRVNPGRVLGWLKLKAPGQELPTDEPLTRIWAVEEWDEDFTALVVFPDQERAGRLTLVLNGVTYERDYPRPAYISTPSLPRDIGATQLVESNQLEQMLKKLERAYWRLLLQMALHPERLDQDQKQRLRVVLTRLTTKLMASPDPLADRLLSMPLFEAWDGSWLELGEIARDYQERGYLLVTRRSQPWSRPPLGRELVVRYNEALVQGFPKWKSGDALLYQAEQAHLAERRFRAQSPRPPSLEGQASSPLSFRLSHSQGVAGLKDDPHEPTTINFLRTGRLLDRRCYPERFPPGLAFEVEHPSLIPNPSWEGLADQCQAAAVIETELKERLEEFYLAWNRPARSRAYLAWTAGDAPELAHQKLYPMSDGSLASLESLRQRVQGDHLEAVERPYSCQLEPVPVAIPELEALFVLKKVDQRFESRSAEETYRQVWLDKYQPTQPQLSGSHLWKASFGPHQLAARDNAREPSRAYCWREGRPLGEMPLRLDEMPFGFDLLLVSDRFLADRYWARVEDGKELESLLEQGRGILKKFFQQVPPRDHLRAYLFHLHSRDEKPPRCLYDYPLVKDSSLDEISRSSSFVVEDVELRQVLRSWFGERIAAPAREELWPTSADREARLPARSFLAVHQEENLEIGLIWPFEQTRVAWFQEGQLREEQCLRTLVPFEAVWKAEKAPDLDALANQARRMVVSQVGSGGGPTARRYLLELLARGGWLEEFDQLSLFEDIWAQPRSLDELRGKTVGYFSADWKEFEPLETVLSYRPEDVFLPLSFEQQRALQNQAHLIDLNPLLEEVRKNLAREPKSLERGFFEHAFSHERWSGALSLDGTSPGVELRLKGLSLGSQAFFPELGLVGWLEGAFEPKSDWSGPQRPEDVRAFLKEELSRLFEQLAQEFPAPSTKRFKRARRLVLSWARDNPVSPALQALEVIPTLTGRWLSLGELMEADKFLYAPPGTTTQEDPVLALGNEPLLELLRALVSLVRLPQPETLLESLRRRSLQAYGPCEILYAQLSEPVLCAPNGAHQVAINHAYSEVTERHHHWVMLPVVLQTLGMEPRQAMEAVLELLSTEEGALYGSRSGGMSAPSTANSC